MKHDEAIKEAVIDELLATGIKAMQFGMEGHARPTILYHFTSADGLVGIERAQEGLGVVRGLDLPRLPILKLDALSLPARNVAEEPREEAHGWQPTAVTPR